LVGHSAEWLVAELEFEPVASRAEKMVVRKADVMADLLAVAKDPLMAD
jgi:hypothetical protein